MEDSLQQASKFCDRDPEVMLHVILLHLLFCTSDLNPSRQANFDHER